jgi:tetratricopeptide (TPR) repeat protein
MKLVNEVLSADPENFEALTYKAMILLSQHHFADGLTVAQDAEKINPYNAFLYGLLVDGNVESGHYDSAIANADKMVSIRPDLRSYSRISYIREIYGDNNGAISAMQMAVNAGAPGDEATEWSRIQLGKLYEHIGNLKYAEMNYTIALNERPAYAYALAGLARLSVAAKDYDKAIELYKQADVSLNDYSFKQELAELYEVIGKKQQATELYQQIVKDMETAWTQSKKNDSVGHYADREMAYAYLNVKEYDKALEHAMMEYNRRPDNIDVNETVAWTDYNKGDFKEAMNYIQTAFKTKCKNPVLICRAGLINYKAGNRSAAKELLQEGLKNDPSISISLKTEARQVLSTL